MAPPRQKPIRLAEKLLQIRNALGLSQNGMIRRLGFEGQLIQAHISAYERNRVNRIPPLGVVLQYARCAGIEMEVLVDDSLDLPDELSGESASLSDRRKRTLKNSRRVSSKRF